MAIGPTFIDGKHVLSARLRVLAMQSELFNSRRILLVTPAGGDAQPATFISAREKQKVFSGLGFQVETVACHRLAPRHWENYEPTLYVAQNPIDPTKLPRGLLRAGIDLDKASIFATYAGYSAVVEAVMRCFDGVARSIDICAVIGAKGRVGSKVVELLKNRGLTVVGFDIGDDLQGVRVASAIVSAVGQPGLIIPQMIGGHCQLIIDVGFSYNEHTGEGRGDVAPQCYSLPLAVTPVPGGVGPLQVLTLVERAIAQIPGATFVPWTISVLQ